MTEVDYLPRVADRVLERKLRVAGAVQIKGPKWCGKTATAERAAASGVYLQDPDSGPSYLQLADSKPSLLLVGEEPRLIDEWQMAPQLWDAVRFEIDRGRGAVVLFSRDPQPHGRRSSLRIQGLDGLLA